MGSERGAKALGKCLIGERSGVVTGDRAVVSQRQLRGSLEVTLTFAIHKTVFTSPFGEHFAVCVGGN